MQFIKLILGLILGLPAMLFFGYLAWASIMQIWSTPLGKVLIIGLAITCVIAFLHGLMPGQLRKIQGWRITIPFFFIAGFVQGFVLELRDMYRTEKT